MNNPARIYTLPVIVGILGFSILACIASCLIPALIPEKPIDRASSMLRTRLPEETKVLTNEDNSGLDLPIPGGISDGDIFMILQIPPEKIAEFSNTAKTSSIWKALPLPTEFMDNIFDSDRMPLKTSTGYYLFIDSQEEYNKTYNRQEYNVTIPFYKRPSFNYTFSLFNGKDGKLYIVRIDT